MNQFSILLFFIQVSLQIFSGFGAGNNAGKDSKGTTTAWSEIELITTDGAPWVHFVYMLADNNLDSYGVSDLEEMRENNASVNQLTLVVYVDRCYNCDDTGVLETVSEIYDYYTKEPINGKFNGSKILQKAYDDTTGKHIWYQMYNFENELDSTLSANVGNFTKLMSLFESSRNVEYYALTFWDHGGAWSGYGSDDNTADSSGKQISNLANLFSAVSDGLEESYIGRLDLLGFDACIMADYSVLDAIVSVDGPSIAQYYLASEVSEPGEGWDYTGLMPYDNTTKEATTPTDYGIAIIDSYVHQSEEITTKDGGAGYTLALFDMDKMDRFANEFNSLVKMMTYPVNNYDYGMLMAILRGKSDTIAAEADFYIYDLGLFLDGLIDSEFFNTCPTRFTNVADNVLTYWNDSLLYFDADFLRSDLTGASIFYATNASSLNVFTYYNSDLASDNYIAFLEAVSKSLSVLSNGDGSKLFTNNTCHTPIPSNLTFFLNNIKIDYNSDYDLYKIRAQCGQTVMSAETLVNLRYLWNGSEIDLELASIETKIEDVSLSETDLTVYWDGRIVLFSDDVYNSSNISTILSTSSIEYFFENTNDDIPLGYTIEYPVKIYEIENVKDSETGEINIPTENGLFTTNNASTGYLQVYVLLNNSWAHTDVTATMSLYEINENWGVIGEVSRSSPRILIGDAMVMFDQNMSMSSDYYGNSYLTWPNISAEMIDILGANNVILQTDVIMEASDVLGNFAQEYIVVDNNTVYSTWAPETETTEATETATMGSSAQPMSTDTSNSNSDMISTMSVTSASTMWSTEAGNSGNSGNGGSTSEADSGLSAVSGGVWLAIVLILAAALIIISVLFCRERSLRADGAASAKSGGYLQMTA